MINQDPTVDSIDQQNQDAYDDLIVSIQASFGRLNILIAVCDDLEFRSGIIKRYETEVEPDIRCYRTTLARDEPSLRSALDDLAEKEEYLHNHNNQAVITVIGAEKLLPIKFHEYDDQTELEKFFGYLQWTREALRHHPFSIVLWLTYSLSEKVIRKAPDFWSWRAGVFRFLSKVNKVTPSAETLIPIEDFFENNNQSQEYFLPLPDLLALIEQIEASGNNSDAMLASLYIQASNIYSKELNLAIEYLTKAINIQNKIGSDSELIISLEKIAALYKSQGQYIEAESILIQIVEITKRIFGEDHPDYIKSLNNLALLYYSQKKYTDASVLLINALETALTVLGEHHPNTLIISKNLNTIENR
ncbi:hypothetical protein NIES4071_71950 [Calothrix sp. NIES-4071]|nr:hypothetical protein NIES4071_71950 [Calothrix sp. NIES-4071]BAZ61470.1 hypothetical protein NIES4105_71900 [Calothrix sp. NIES-4105]